MDLAAAYTESHRGHPGYKVYVRKYSEICFYGDVLCGVRAAPS